MGNALGAKKSVKVMKINGETMRFKAPVEAAQVVKDYPGYVLLESEAVKHYGIRAKPLEAHQLLKPKRLYFLVELPKFPEDKYARRVRSGINMSAKDRLESLMLGRRSVSDLSLLKPASIAVEETRRTEGEPVRMKMRVRKADVEKLMMEGGDEGALAEKIVRLCLANNPNPNPNPNASGSLVTSVNDVRVGSAFKPRQKRVGFLAINEGEIQVAS
jgi:hypothetical protein